MTFMKIGAGDGDRTRDIQLGKLRPTLRLTTNQAHRAGPQWPSVALSARIEHNSEHNFPQEPTKDLHIMNSEESIMRRPLAEGEGFEPPAPFRVLRFY